MSDAPKGLPGEPGTWPQHASVHAANNSAAALYAGQINQHVHIDGLEMLGEFLRRHGVLDSADSGPAGDIRRHLSWQLHDIRVHDVVAEQFNQLHDLPEFALDDYYDGSSAQAQADRVIDATRSVAGIVAVLAFWGDAEADKWWMPELVRLARINRHGGLGLLLNLPLVAASMAFYAAGTAAVRRENYSRLLNLFDLHGEPVTPAGPAPLPRMLAPNPSAIALTANQNYRVVSPILADALHLRSDDVEDAWQRFEILRLATQLMAHQQFDPAVGIYTAADRRRTSTTGIDPIATPLALATQNKTLDDLARCCHPNGLHLCAMDKVWTPGTNFRWGSPVAEWVAAEVHRKGDQHPLVSGLNTSPERIELALRAVGRAVGEAAIVHRANWVSGAGPEAIWLDS